MPARLWPGVEQMAKTCRGCGRKLLMHRDPGRSDFQAARRHADGLIEFMPKCKQCRRLEAKAYRQKVASTAEGRARTRRYRRESYQRLSRDPEWRKRKGRKAGATRKRRRAQDPEYAAHLREQDRRYAEQRKADPDRHARRLEGERLRYRLKREMEGAQGRPAARSIRPQKQTLWLPREPIQDWLRKQIERERLRLMMPARYGERIQAEVASRCGVSPRLLYSILNGRGPIGDATVDLVLTGHGGASIWQLYPGYPDAYRQEAAAAQ